MINSTVANNYAEGQGGGILAAGRLGVVDSTVTGNIAPVGANLGAGGDFSAVGSIIGPAFVDAGSGDAQASRQSCRVYNAASAGYNLVTDASCSLTSDTDLVDYTDPMLAALEDDPNGLMMFPLAGSPARARISTGQCLPAVRVPFPAGQLLGPDQDTYVDWADLLSRDQAGTVRDTGSGCDIGAAQTVAARAQTTGSSPGLRADHERTSR